MTELLSSLSKLPLCAFKHRCAETSAMHQAGVIAGAGFNVHALLLLWLNKVIC